MTANLRVESLIRMKNVRKSNFAIILKARCLIAFEEFFEDLNDLGFFDPSDEAVIRKYAFLFHEINKRRSVFNQIRLKCSYHISKQKWWAKG